MGAVQLGKMSNGVLTPLKTPFILTIVVVCLIWSLLALDMPTVSSLNSDVSNGVQEPIPEAQDETTKVDNGSQKESGTPSGSDAVVTIPTEPSSKGQDGETGSAVEGSPAATSTLTVHESEAASKQGSDLKKASDRPLILYAYADSETGSALANLEFFLAHGIHAAADFIFILNGETETDVVGLIPKKENIRIVKRPNDCYDLGAYAEVLLADDLYKSYKRFITMNASVRGPFVPYWSEGCWTDMFLSKVTDEVKLVGITANCWPTFHIQSMIWATDLIGIETLLFPPQKALDHLSTHPIKLPPPKEDDSEDDDDSPAPAPKPSPETSAIHQAPGINGCFHSWESAVAAEISSTSLILAAGYKVDAMMSAYHGSQEYEETRTCEKNRDLLFDKEYFGINVHPFETVFIKANRDVAPLVLARHTAWVDQRGYSSYDYCKA